MRRRDILLIAGVLLLILLAAGAWLLRDGADSAGADAAGGGIAGLAAPAVLGRATGAQSAAAPDAAAARRAELAAEAVHAPGVQRLVADGAPGADASWADAREISFRGRVIDERGAPLAGAVVAYWPNDVTQALYGVDPSSFGAALDALPRALTGADGRFELRGRQREGRGVTGLHDVPSLVVIAGELAIRSHACESIGHAADYDAGDIAMESGARLVGRVVDPAGRFIAGATVMPWSAAGISLERLSGGAVRGVTQPGSLLAAAFAATTSDADGRFETGPLWPGSTQLSVRAQGFQPLIQNAMLLPASPTDVGEVVLAAGLVLAGVVLDDRGAPVRGANIFVWKIQPGSSEALSLGDIDGVPKLLSLRATAASTLTTTTDARGRFEIGSLVPGSHDVIVDAADFELLRSAAELPSGSGERVLKLVRAATLRLKVVEAASFKPLAAATVTARRFTGSKADAVGIALPVTATGAPGTLLVERLGLRRTVLSIGAPGFATKNVELPGATPSEQLERTVALDPGASISGSVTTQDGTPILGADVVASFEDAGTPPPARSVADERGHFVFDALATGEWLLRADADGFGPVERPIRVVAGQHHANEHFVLPGAGVVFGSGLRADGTPKSGLMLYLTWLDAEGQPRKETTREATSDADGRYELRDMQPGTWRSATRPPVEFTLAPGERRQLDFRDDPPATVQGRVLQANGLPSRDACVFVHWTGPGGRDRVTLALRVDRDGYYLWDKDRPGHLELMAASPTGGVSPAAVLELPPGEARIVDLILGSVRVAGRVMRLGDDTPVAGATVRLLPLLDGDVAGIFGNVTLGGETTEFGVAHTDGDGRFALEQLAPGNYSVTVEGPGLSGGALPPLSVGAAGALDLVLRVATAGSVSGTVRHASGAPWMEKAWVSAYGGHGRCAAQTIDGRFTLEGLAPGDWRLTLLFGNGPRVEQHVTVLSGQSVTVELVVP